MSETGKNNYHVEKDAPRRREITLSSSTSALTVICLTTQSFLSLKRAHLNHASCLSITFQPRSHPTLSAECRWSDDAAGETGDSGDSGVARPCHAHH
jgi:hypothetical protein